MQLLENSKSYRRPLRSWLAFSLWWAGLLTTSAAHHDLVCQFWGVRLCQLRVPSFLIASGGVGAAIAPRPRPALSTPCPFSLKMCPNSELSSPLVLWAPPCAPSLPQMLKPSGSPRYPPGSPPSRRDPRPGEKPPPAAGETPCGARAATPCPSSSRSQARPSVHRAPPADQRPAPALRARRTEGELRELQSQRGLRGKGQPRRGEQGEWGQDGCGRQLCGALGQERGSGCSSDPAGSSFRWEPRDQRKGEHVGAAPVTPTPPRAAQRDVLSTQNFAAWPHRAAKALGSVVCIQASTQAAGSWDSECPGVGGSCNQAP